MHLKQCRNPSVNISSLFINTSMKTLYVWNRVLWNHHCSVLMDFVSKPYPMYLCPHEHYKDRIVLHCNATNRFMFKNCGTKGQGSCIFIQIDRFQQLHTSIKVLYMIQYYICHQSKRDQVGVLPSRSVTQ